MLDISKQTKRFYEFNLNGRKVVFHTDNIIELQESKGKGKYKTVAKYGPWEFEQAVMHYNMKAAHNGYNKRLICKKLNKPVLARQLSR
jgi:hypothetical protein